MHCNCSSPKEIGKVLEKCVFPNKNVVIHILAHGGELGISRKDNQYYLEVIIWIY